MLLALTHEADVPVECEDHQVVLVSDDDVAGVVAGYDGEVLVQRLLGTPGVVVPKADVGPTESGPL